MARLTRASGLVKDREHDMKFVIASDIHGNAEACDQLTERVLEFAPDRLLLLGDLLYHGPRNVIPVGYDPRRAITALNALAAEFPVTAVRGNCDAEVDQMVLDFPIMADYAVVAADGALLVLTHGHLYDALAGEVPAECVGAAALLSGHTHVKVLRRLDNGLVLVNPGSVGIPKDGSASYATYEDGTFALRTLDGAVLQALSLAAASGTASGEAAGTQAKPAADTTVSCAAGTSGAADAAAVDGCAGAAPSAALSPCSAE